MKCIGFQRSHLTVISTVIVTATLITSETVAQSLPNDPGLRAGPPAAGDPLPGLTAEERTKFEEFKEIFEDVEGVDDGLGPRFNLNSCVGCHSQPATGGSSPPFNPQIAVATLDGARNRIPSFLSLNGPVREARQVRARDGSADGGVVPLFVITGRSDAQGCNIAQPDYSNVGNFIFRIPTPTFGMGLIEAIPDKTLRDNLNRDSPRKRTFGVRGRFNTSPEGRLNTSGNDGTITRFGWKAQNKSPMVFAGEAYNVEMGITNDLFPNEREGNCPLNGTPEDHFDANTGETGDVLPFAVFMRFLDQPKPAPATPSITAGRFLFNQVGCALCHTPTLTTGNSSFPPLSNKEVNLFSDLAVHDMGVRLADGVTQGQAGPREFRTAPLWGLGQRIFFLHDGRTSNLLEAIRQHASVGSEANNSVASFDRLRPADQQNILNFLRSL